jgi:hypothetical protein
MTEQLSASVKKYRRSQGWARRAAGFIETQYDPAPGGYPSVPGGAVTLYGTIYGLLTRHYLGGEVAVPAGVRQFLIGCQDPETGYFIGPEMREWTSLPGAKHDREHLLLHLTCAALPVMQEFGMGASHPLRFAHRFGDSSYLAEWLEQRDMSDAWLEGNNLLFVGQLLVHLRDIEGHPGAGRALDQWFRWLDDTVDSATGLWGTGDGKCSPFVAMCGGYHQLLVYYHQGRPLRSPERLVDTVLRLQHPDGGFSHSGGGGACEDVDAIDILVNLYKRLDYRRPAIRVALRGAADSILRLQNADGGFPYKRGIVQDHMGIPATRAAADTSTTFATWFRVHTLALMAEVLTDDVRLDIPFRFNRFLSMGWHAPWRREENQVRAAARFQEIRPTLRLRVRRVKHRLRRQTAP